MIGFWHTKKMSAARLALLVLFGAVMLSAQESQATFYPRAGWQAELSQDHHDVSGTVTIVDEDTLRVDDFTFDGGGLNVYFYLGASDSAPDFSSGLSIGAPLLGMSFDGTEGPMLIDLPPATTLDGYNAISVWCVPAGVSFGSGTFIAAETAVPEPSTFALAAAGLLGLSLFAWRRRTRR